MFTDYFAKDEKCIVCNSFSDSGPLCKNCYTKFKNYMSSINKINSENYKLTTQSTLEDDLIQLFTFIEILEYENLINDQTPFLMDLARKIKTLSKETQIEILNNQELTDPRKKWPAKYRCKDGHYVRSRAELLIDNWLLEEKIVHIYEKQVLFKNGEKRLCDFYLPQYDTYIEFWGRNDEYYTERKKEKTNFYKEDNLKLISLEDKHLENIDDVLSELIFKRG